nr:anoctamin-6-like isoform X1 [Biomphalaria glabrata]
MSILRKLSTAPKEKQTDEIITLSIRPLNQTDNQSTNDVDLDPSNAHEAQIRGSLKFVDASNKEDDIYSQEIPVDLKHIDFVLVHKTAATTDKDEDKTSKQLINMREAFEKKMTSEGLVIYKRKASDLVFTIIHCPFKRLCIEAEKVKLQLPLKDMGIKQTVSGLIQSYTNKYLETEKNVVKFICTPFIMKQFHFFENHDDPDTFFMTAIRSLLVHNILIKCDIRSEIEKLEEDKEENIQLEIFEPVLVKVQSLHMKGLNYMLMKKAYIQCFPLHEESQLDTMYTSSNLKKQLPILTKNYTEENDIRLQLNKEWTTMFGYQPIWKIRCYFGEKIAFYFAWAGMFVTTLWVPMVIGWVVFSYGLYQSFTSPLKKEGTEDEVDVINSLKRAFDNKATPIFALFMCCWGTIFLEVWKQHSSRLAFEWSVESFEYDEPKRPQFYGTKIVKDPVTEEEVWFYPYWLRAIKFFASGTVLFFMVITVIASVSGIIVYRVIVSVDFCPKMNGKECFLLTSVTSSVLNALSITILVHIYDKLALYLTEWENHRTQTDYDNALIVKLFAFRFVNSYSSCFYIAFLREYVGILEKDYVDTCHGSCMSQLTVQIMVLIITSMVPKFLIDIGYTIVRSVFLSFGMCDRFTKASQVLTDNEEKDQVLLYIEKEFLKRDAGDITLSEFTEKVILYGYLMIFAASFPLAPMFVIGLCFFDMRLDASRLLRFYKRPVAHISQNIGIWYAILNFLNIVGVTSNAFLIAFTSSWGQQFNTMEKLIVVIIFEHLVFALKFFLAVLIPDESFSVNLAKKRKKYVVQQRFLMEEDLSKKQERIDTDPVDDLNKDTENVFKQRSGVEMT